MREDSRSGISSLGIEARRPTSCLVLMVVSIDDIKCNIQLRVAIIWCSLSGYLYGVRQRYHIVLFISPIQGESRHRIYIHRQTRTTAPDQATVGRPSPSLANSGSTRPSIPASSLSASPSSPTHPSPARSPNHSSALTSITTHFRLKTS